MEGPVRTSVIVVSRHRPDELSRCLRALILQDHPEFEVVVVADPEAARRVEDEHPGAFKVVPFDVANISMARNAGLESAAGEVVAFIDDDAVAEPTWLARLVAPFADPNVVAAGGFVRGWTGLHLAFNGGTIDRLAREGDLPLDFGRVTVLAPPPDGAIVTIGTNCAFRAAALRSVGGFDPAFAYFLDESDANLRLAATGGLTAMVPDAEVMHFPAASARRLADRMPRHLHDVGASTAIFARRHAAPDDLPAALDALRARERRRLIRFMVAGRLLPGDVGRLLRSLEDGIAEGRSRALAPALRPAPQATGAAPAFRRVAGDGTRRGRLITGWLWPRAGLRRRAAEEAGKGRVVTLILLTPGILAHRVVFAQGGWWEQTGGLFGPVAGRYPGPITARPATRVAAELRRIARVRPVEGGALPRIDESAEE